MTEKPINEVWKNEEWEEYAKGVVDDLTDRIHHADMNNYPATTEENARDTILTCLEYIRYLEQSHD